MQGHGAVWSSVTEPWDCACTVPLSKHAKPRCRCDAAGLTKLSCLTWQQGCAGKAVHSEPAQHDISKRCQRTSVAHAEVLRNLVELQHGHAGKVACSKPASLTDLDVKEGQGGQRHVIRGRRQLEDIEAVVMLCNLQAGGEDASGLLACRTR